MLRSWRRRRRHARTLANIARLERELFPYLDPQQRAADKWRDSLARVAARRDAPDG